MNADEIYKKYIAPDPEPESPANIESDEERIKGEYKNLLIETKKSNYIKHTGSPTTPGQQPGNYIKRGFSYDDYWDMIGGPRFGAGHRFGETTTFKVDDVKLSMDNSMYGGALQLKLICSLGDFRCVVERYIDRCSLEHDSDSIINRIIDECTKEIINTLITSFEIEKKLNESLYQNITAAALPSSFKHLSSFNMP